MEYPIQFPWYKEIPLLQLEDMPAHVQRLNLVIDHWRRFADMDPSRTDFFHSKMAIMDHIRYLDLKVDRVDTECPRKARDRAIEWIGFFQQFEMLTRLSRTEFRWRRALPPNCSKTRMAIGRYAGRF